MAKDTINTTTGQVTHRDVFTHTGNQLAAVTTTVAADNPAQVGEGYVWTTDPVTGDTHGQIQLTTTGETTMAPNPAANGNHNQVNATDTTNPAGPQTAPTNPATNWDQDHIDATFYALVCDLAGAPHELINTTTGVIEGYATQTLYGTRTWTGAHTSPLLFAGQYEDAESGWAYNRFRYYNPVLGAYNAQDPLGLAPRLASAQGYVDHAAFWVDVLGLASHVKNKQLQKQIDALTPDKKGKLGERLAQDRFKGQFDTEAIRGKNYPSLTRSAEYRVPDIMLNNGDIVESKFIKNIAAGDRPWEGAGMDLQIKDGIEFTRNNGTNYHLVVPPNVTISPQIQAMFDSADHAHIIRLGESEISNALASKAYL